MKITHTSDTHGYHKHLKLTGGDVLIFSGDYTGGRRREAKQFYEFLQWMSDQRYDHKILVAGNHDFVCETMGYNDVRSFTDPLGITYLCDTGIWIDDRFFWGSPWQPEFYNWAFNLPRNGEELRRKWEKIPIKTSVLITHGPPHGILDKNDEDHPCGCELLKKKVTRLPALELHCFGHIHESYSAKPVIVSGAVEPFLASNASAWNHLADSFTINPAVDINLD